AEPARLDSGPAGEHDLLLMAAAQQPHGTGEARRADVEARAEGADLATAPPRPGQEIPRQGEATDADVVDEVQIEQQPLPLTILGQEGDSAPERVARRARSSPAATDVDG